MKPESLEQFKAGIKARADILRRHGLMDPAERSKGFRKPRQTSAERERIVKLPEEE